MRGASFISLASVEAFSYLRPYADVAESPTSQVRRLAAEPAAEIQLSQPRRSRSRPRSFQPRRQQRWWSRHAYRFPFPTRPRADSTAAFQQSCCISPGRVEPERAARTTFDARLGGERLRLERQQDHHPDQVWSTLDNSHPHHRYQQPSFCCASRRGLRPRSVHRQGRITQRSQTGPQGRTRARRREAQTRAQTEVEHRQGHAGAVAVARGGKRLAGGVHDDPRDECGRREGAASE